MPLRMLRYIVALVLAVAALLPQTGAAQEQAAAATQLVAEQQKALDTLTRKADGFEKQIDLDSEDDAKLVEIRLGLEGVSREALHSALTFRPRLADHLGLSGMLVTASRDVVRRVPVALLKFRKDPAALDGLLTGIESLARAAAASAV